MSSAAAEFSYAPLLPTGPDQTEYRLVTDEGSTSSTVRVVGGSSPWTRPR